MSIFFRNHIFFGAILLLAHNSMAQNHWVIWDDKPATDWMTEAYPIGNGDLGAMVFGGIHKDHIQFNEKSLWTGDEQETGSYQAFGDVYIQITDSVSNPSNYKRSLNLNSGIVTVSYENNKKQYSRQYFTSAIDSIISIQYETKDASGISGKIYLEDAHGSATQMNASKNVLYFSDALDNGLHYNAGIGIKNKGGDISFQTDDKGHHIIVFRHVNSFRLYLHANTNYSNSSESNWRSSGDGLRKLLEITRKASQKNYLDLKNNHELDYKNLFNRVHLRLGSKKEYADALRIPTNQLVGQKKFGRYLDALLFQYGRYLMISSSRAGGLPANLQGVWNNSNNPPWRSDYHSDINVQMNYWPAETTNLSECAIPYLDFINFIRPVKKRLTQEEYGDVRGWTLKGENNIFGGQSFSWNTPGSAWMSRALWEHYQFTQDINFLKSFAYPILKEVTEFWDDHLKRRGDGILVAPQGWSPEHGPVEDGVTYDQEIIFDLFNNYIKAASVLNVDTAYRKRISKMKENLLKPQIGSWGQLQEWEIDRDDPNDHHRHISHLYALHPGIQISPLKTPKLAEAAKTSLVARGSGSTGWAMAWKINFWARLLDGNQAYNIIENFKTLVDGQAKVDYNFGGGIYSNLLCSHPPFQIDGNFGFTAAVAEMLLQSQQAEIHVIPALPKAWKTGEISGLKARGGFVIDSLKWDDSQVTSLKIRSLAGKKCIIRAPNKLVFPNIKNVQEHVEEVAWNNTLFNYYIYTFPTSSNHTYELHQAN